MAELGERLKNAWRAFTGRDPTYGEMNIGPGSSYYPGRARYRTIGANRSIVSSIYNQIAVDCASIDIEHVRVDEDGNYSETINDSLNQVFTVSANVDQSGRELIRDCVISMLDEGCIAIVPTVTSADPIKNKSFEIYELRVGRVVSWHPYDVLVELYNEKKGERENILLPKRIVALVENPFYNIMNEPNSLLQRLIRVLGQLDRTNEENAAGKLDMIVQVPYQIRTKAREKYAEARRNSIENQLNGSKYGIAYTDATEKVIQLNRSLENNLWTQAKELQEQLFSQMGFSPSIFDGSANEQTMLNYQSRTLEPILTSITEAMDRKWISRTARSQGQAIRYYKDPFKLVPVNQIAEIADKFTRNEIMTSNEIRSKIGLKPSDDPKANELRNSNLNHPDEKMEIQKGE